MITQPLVGPPAHEQGIVSLVGTFVIQHAGKIINRRLIISQCEIAFTDPVQAVAGQPVIRVLVVQRLKRIDGFSVIPVLKGFQRLLISFLKIAGFL